MRREVGRTKDLSAPLYVLLLARRQWTCDLTGIVIYEDRNV